MTKCWVGLGGILAIILSWSINKSILWLIIHFILNWIYVVYFLFKHMNLEQIVKGFIK